MPSNINKVEIKKVVGSILCGNEETDTDFGKAVPKYYNMKEYSAKFSTIFYLLSKISDRSENIDRDLAIFKEYNELLNENIEEIFQIDDEKVDYLLKLHPMIPPEEKENKLKFIRAFNEMKKSKLINTIIITCSNLVQHEKHLVDKETLKDEFLTRSSIMTFSPVQDLNVNFKMFYSDPGLSANSRKFILLCLHKIYAISKALYDEYCKVDIDTEAFVKAVHMTVDELKKKIPRCERAFNKILESTDLLRNNYDDYYKDYMGSGNSSIIAENFIYDVAQTVKKDTKLTFQFKQIIKQLRNLTKNVNGKDIPKNSQASELESIFDQFNVGDDNEEESGSDVDAEIGGSSDEDIDFVHEINGLTNMITEIEQES